MEVVCKFRPVNYTFEKNRNHGGYTCRVENIIFKENSRLIEIIGDHEEGKDNSDVVGVSIDNLKHIKEFPRGFGEIFPNLQYFQVRRSSLKTLHIQDFIDLGNLRGLWMPENLLISLPSDLFLYVQGLRHISFYKNHLKYIGRDILKPLTLLERANFNDNNAINISYDMDKDPQEKLQELKDQIAKCQPPVISAHFPAIALPVNSATLEARLQSLENEVRALKTENQHLSAKVGPLEAQVANLQLSVAHLHNMMQ